MRIDPLVIWKALDKEMLMTAETSNDDDDDDDYEPYGMQHDMHGVVKKHCMEEDIRREHNCLALQIDNLLCKLIKPHNAS
eukprot:4113235-Ditylum_brightwellii.AAC.1